MRMMVWAFAVAALLAPQQRSPGSPSQAGPPSSQTPARDRPRPAATGTASIAGRIVIMGSTSPVRRARVTLEGMVAIETGSTDTDTDGAYRFDNLAPGAYRVKADKPGFVTLEYGAKHPFTRPSPIELEDGQAMRANLAMPRGGALEGRIVDETGEPVENLTVAAIHLGYTANGRKPATTAETTTDDLGRFRIHSLPPGDYYIQAVPNPTAISNAAAVPGRASLGLARTYYPGTPALDQARSVSIAVGQDLSNLDFAVTRVPVSRVTGQVIAASGTPPAICSWRLQPVAGGSAGTSGFADPRQLSNIMYPAVPPGEYWLLGTARSAPGADVEFGMTRVSIAGHDMSGIVVRTERGARLDGRLELDAKGSPPSTTDLEVAPQSVQFDWPNPDGPGAAAMRLSSPVGADGRFAVPSLFGPHLVRMNRLPAHWALKEVWLDEAEITDVITDFSATAAPRVLRVVITDRTGSLTGTVTDGRGHAADDYRVVVFADAASRRTQGSRFVKSALPASDHRFTIDGLLPGKYLVAAVEWLEDEAWNDPAVLQRLRPIAVPLAVAEGTRQTVTLTLKGLS